MNTEAIHLIYVVLYKYHMYAQFQRDNITKYKYEVLDVLKLVKK